MRVFGKSERGSLVGSEKGEEDDGECRGDGFCGELEVNGKVL